MKRREVLKKIELEAKRQGKSFRTFERKRHLGVQVGGVNSVISRHTEIREEIARAFFKQFEPELGKGWWRS